MTQCPIKQEAATPEPPTPRPEEGITRRVLGRLNDAIGAERVRRLLGDRAALRCEQGVLEVRVPDRFSADMVERRLGEQLRACLAQEAPGREIGVRVVVSPDNQPSTGARGHDAPAAPASSTAHQDKAGPDNAPRPLPDAPDRRAAHASRPHPGRTRLPEYIVGAPNRVAHEAVRRAGCERDGPELVFVHGPCGVGKTHLLKLAASMCRRARPQARIRYTTGESFVGGFVASVRNGTLPSFQNKHRRLDLLVIDDIHIVAGKDGSQQELVRTLNDLHFTGARVVLASDAHPRDIGRLHDALASRFVSGVVAPVGCPDSDMTRRLIPALASRRGLVLDPRAHELIVHRVLEDDAATVRDIEGLLTQIQAVANLMDHHRALFLNAEHVRQAVQMRAGKRAGQPSGPISIQRIIDAVCRELGVTRDDLAGKGRAKKVVLARELVTHLGKRHTARSYPELATAIGRPNHSTVITAHQRFQTRLAAPAPLQVGAAIDGCSAGELVGKVERAMGVA